MYYGRHYTNKSDLTLKVHKVTFGKTACILRKNIVLVVLRLCADEYDYPTAHKTRTTRLKRYNQFRRKGSQAD